MTVLTEDDIGVCNCCLCGRELLGDRTARLLNSGEAVTAAALPPPVADYAHGRPICADCQRARVQADKEEVARLRKGGRVPARRKAARQDRTNYEDEIGGYG